MEVTKIEFTINYASVGGATGHTVVGLCMYVCVYMSVCRQDFSSLAEN